MEAGVRIFSLCRSINHSGYRSLLTASRTVPTNQRRFMSQESAADVDKEKSVSVRFERSKPYFSESREDFDHQAFPSARTPLSSQSWRQFLTTDEKTIVCVHPAKSVPIQDTKVDLYYCTFMLGKLFPGKRDLQTCLSPSPSRSSCVLNGLNGSFPNRISGPFYAMKW